MDLRRELIEVEEHIWRAAGDRERYAEHLAADAIRVFPGWGVASREAVLRGVAETDTWKTFTIEDPEVIMLGDDAQRWSTGPVPNARLDRLTRRR